MVKTFWFDMDGVLAIYERNAYIKNYKQGECIEKTPIYLQPEKHYYRTVQPDVKMIEVVKLLQYKSAHSVRIITNVSPDELIRPIQVEDKLDWLHKYCPFITTEQFFWTTSTKSERVLEITKNQLITDCVNLKLDTSQILIDDFNKNLLNWQNAGGTAIKYINGLNDPKSFNGIIIPDYITDSFTIAKSLSDL